MLHKEYKLKEIFPVLAKESTVRLAEIRRAEMEKTGDLNEWWAPYTEPTVTAYCPSPSPEIDMDVRRTSVLICPGGCYKFVSSREGEPVALAFAEKGYNAFVLNYECTPSRYPQSLLEAAAAVSFIRRNAQAFCADTEKIAVCGFSAGGHLAASLGVFWDEPFLRRTLGLNDGEARPNAMILGYPVITSGRHAHRESFDCLLGKDPAPELLRKTSLELQVNEKTPPAFIFHTFDDETVPVENSLLFAGALREHGIPFELHVFPWGEHGLSLGKKFISKRSSQINPHFASWMPLCGEWLDLLFKN